MLVVGFLMFFYQKYNTVVGHMISPSHDLSIFRAKTALIGFGHDG